MKLNTKIHIPTEEENQAALKAFFSSQKTIQTERRAAVEKAIPALDRLAQVMRERSGQPYKIRSILYSIWNGKPACMIEILSLDWELRKDLMAVLLAFGYEDKTTSFFYNAIQSAVTKAGQWNWFLEEQHNVQALKDYVEAEAKAA